MEAQRHCYAHVTSGPPPTLSLAPHPKSLTEPQDAGLWAVAWRRFGDGDVPRLPGRPPSTPSSAPPSIIVRPADIRRGPRESDSPPNGSVEWVLATRLRLLVVLSMPALFRKPKVPFFVPETCSHVRVLRLSSTPWGWKPHDSCFALELGHPRRREMAVGVWGGEVGRKTVIPLKQLP